MLHRFKKWLIQIAQWFFILFMIYHAGYIKFRKDIKDAYSEDKLNSLEDFLIQNGLTVKGACYDKNVLALGDTCTSIPDYCDNSIGNTYKYLLDTYEKIYVESDCNYQSVCSAMDDLAELDLQVPEKAEENKRLDIRWRTVLTKGLEDNIGEYTHKGTTRPDFRTIYLLANDHTEKCHSVGRTKAHENIHAAVVTYKDDAKRLGWLPFSFSHPFFTTEEFELLRKAIYQGDQFVADDFKKMHEQAKVGFLKNLHNGPEYDEYIKLVGILERDYIPNCAFDAKTNKTVDKVAAFIQEADDRLMNKEWTMRNQRVGKVSYLLFNILVSKFDEKNLIKEYHADIMAQSRAIVENFYPDVYKYQQTFVNKLDQALSENKLKN